MVMAYVLKITFIISYRTEDFYDILKNASLVIFMIIQKFHPDRDSAIHLD